nr:30S ribosomal protein S10, chloroplastic [Ipomoea batatas]GMC54516.1 30S ribosomal protein S10, chloroplastic [Ipomoea batatas]
MADVSLRHRLRFQLRRAIMAISSSTLSATVFPVYNCNSSAISAKPKLYFTSLPPKCANFQPTEDEASATLIFSSHL